MKITDFFIVKLANKPQIGKTSFGSFWSFLVHYSCKLTTPTLFIFFIYNTLRPYLFLFMLSIIVSVCQRTLSLSTTAHPQCKDTKTDWRYQNYAELATGKY
jgi:hypothetical protein